MIIDHCDKTISIKIVYFGPAYSGKTASIKSLFSHFGKADKIASIESTVSRTLFFDYGTLTDIVKNGKRMDAKIYIDRLDDRKRKIVAADTYFTILRTYSFLYS